MLLKNQLRDGLFQIEAKTGILYWPTSDSIGTGETASQTKVKKCTNLLEKLFVKLWKRYC
jgi:triosephosphate isomerase